MYAPRRNRIRNRNRNRTFNRNRNGTRNRNRNRNRLTQAAQVDGRDAHTGEWRTLMPKLALQGHAVHRYRIAAAASGGLNAVSAVRVLNFPDGGLSRLGLYGNDLPAAEQQRFPPPAQSEQQQQQQQQPVLAVERVREPIPPVQKALSDLGAAFAPTPADVRAAWALVKLGDELDVAGARARQSTSTTPAFAPECVWSRVRACVRASERASVRAMRAMRVCVCVCVRVCAWARAWRPVRGGANLHVRAT
jgi:hypothetical protein